MICCPCAKPTHAQVKTRHSDAAAADVRLPGSIVSIHARFLRQTMTVDALTGRGQLPKAQGNASTLVVCTPSSAVQLQCHWSICLMIACSQDLYVAIV